MPSAGQNTDQNRLTQRDTQRAQQAPNPQRELPPRAPTRIVYDPSSGTYSNRNDIQISPVSTQPSALHPRSREHPSRGHNEYNEYVDYASALEQIPTIPDAQPQGEGRRETHAPYQQDQQDQRAPHTRRSAPSPSEPPPPPPQYLPPRPLPPMPPVGQARVPPTPPARSVQAPNQLAGYDPSAEVPYAAPYGPTHDAGEGAVPQGNAAPMYPPPPYAPKGLRQVYPTPMPARRPGYQSPAYEVPLDRYAGPEEYKAEIPRRPIAPGIVPGMGAHSGGNHDDEDEQDAEPVSVWVNVIQFALVLVEVLLALRFLLRLLAANPDAFFSALVYDVTAPIMAPFSNVFGNSGVGGHVFAWSVLLAAAVYALLAWGLIALAHFFEHPSGDDSDWEDGTPTTSPEEPPPVPPSPPDPILR